MAGHHSRVVRREPYISMTNGLKRIAFEKDHIHKLFEFWRTVIFSDEGKFCIFGIKGCKLVWRKPCTALQKEHLVPMRPTNHCLFNTLRLYRISAPSAAPPVLTSKNEKGLFPRLLKLEERRIVTSVAAEFGINKNVVLSAWRAFQTTGTAVRKVGGGRPRTTTVGDDRYIILQAKRGRQQLASAIAQQLCTATG
ncbi:transposable element Tcb2 transposase [Trichonephila clavipes]|nr:transposable element Tcb2 transposase [Trichonephila clavipes]